MGSVGGEVLFSRMGRRRSEVLTRRSKERVAEANGRTAEVEKLTACGTITSDQMNAVAEAVRP